MIPRFHRFGPARADDHGELSNRASDAGDGDDSAEASSPDLAAAPAPSTSDGPQ